MQEPDSELLRRAAGGDAGAFGSLARLMGGGIFSVARTVLGDRASAEDAVQEILLKIYASIRRFGGRSRFSTWVYRITCNHCLDILRKRVSNPVKTSIDGFYFSAGETASSCFSPDRDIEKLENRLVIEQALSRLSPESRLILTLREISGLDYADIAETLGCGVGTVKSRLFRAREELRKQLFSGVAAKL